MYGYQAHAISVQGRLGKKDELHTGQIKRFNQWVVELDDITVTYGHWVPKAMTKKCIQKIIFVEIIPPPRRAFWRLEGKMGMCSAQVEPYLCTCLAMRREERLTPQTGAVTLYTPGGATCILLDIYGWPAFF